MNLTKLEEHIHDALPRVAVVEQPGNAKHPYKEVDGGIVWLKPGRDGNTQVTLTNFTAKIVRQVEKDDGVETRLAFEIRAALSGHAMVSTIAATSFAAMNWPVELLGAEAIVMPGFGTKDHARAAVQSLSGIIPRHRVFTHCGWRQVDGQHVYLHGGGGIGADGPVADVDVSLPPQLAPLVLPQPPVGDELRAAVDAFLRGLDAAPDRITVPVFGAALRAVLGDADLSVHESGPTNTFKSELAALAMSCFGAGFDAHHLPGSWDSTANALGELQFLAKDALLVIDDFAPGGSRTDVDRMHRDADRVMRAQGNRSGRGRMRADTSLRQTRPPRGLVLSTGEDVPKGHSLRTRLIVVDVSPGDVDQVLLTGAQADARRGLYASMMAGYLRWLALHRDSEKLRERVNTLRGSLIVSLPRTGTNLAQLMVGWERLIAFAVDVAALSTCDAEKLRARVQEALLALGASQEQHQAGADPVRRYLSLLASAIARGDAHVATTDGKAPSPPGLWGWRERHAGSEQFFDPQGKRIGWRGGDNLYLDPESAMAAAQVMATHLGEPLAVAAQTMTKRLHQRGVLMSTEHGHLTVYRVCDGGRRRVLHLSASALTTSDVSPRSQPGISGTSGIKAETGPAANSGDGTESPFSVPENGAVAGLGGDGFRGQTPLTEFIDSPPTPESPISPPLVEQSAWQDEERF